MTTGSGSNTRLRNKALDWKSLDALTQPEPKHAYDYWVKKRGDRLMPSPRDIDPAEIPRLLPFILLIEVLDEEPPDYLYRIEGESVRATAGFVQMGYRNSELIGKYGAAYEHTAIRLADVCATKLPRAKTFVLRGIGRGYYTTDAVWLPFSRDGAKVDQILTCFGFVKRPEDQPSVFRSILR